MFTTSFTFGIYPLHVAGTPFGIADGPADDFEKIGAALADIRGERTLVPRTYLIYTSAWEERMLANAELYARCGLLGDVVIGCGDWTVSDQAITIENWLEFIRKIIRTHGARLSSVQITNEPNLSFMEGSKPYVYQALIEGTLAARAEIVRLQLPTKVGFGSVPDGPAAIPGFWERLAQVGSEDFLRAIDFVGHNFYVDVFEDQPVPTSEFRDIVEQHLSALRGRLDSLALPSSVAIRVTENGWPTGINPLTGRARSPERQAEALEALIRAVAALRGAYGVTHYALFALRDADSGNNDLFHQYGILRDDYTKKPAYSTFCALVRELGD